MSEDLWRGCTRGIGLLVVATVALIVGGGHAFGAAASDRGYELVSPPDKGGQATYYSPVAGNGTTQSARSGEAAVFTSWGSFAGARSGMPTSYRAGRVDGVGWMTAAASPPPGMPDPDAVNFSASWTDASDEIDVGVLETADTFDSGDVNRYLDVYRADLAGQVSLVSRGNNGQRTGPLGATYSGMSPDGTKIVFATASHLVPQDIGRTAPDAQDIYEHFGGVTRLVSMGPDDRPLGSCGSQLGGNTVRNAISSDGSRVFFQVPSPYGHSDPSCQLPAQLYMREKSTSTVHISGSQRTVPDPAGVQNAAFQGATRDGRSVFFSSAEMLTDTATPGGGIYQFDTSTRKLAFLSAVGDQILKISPDGSRIYFVSSSTLLPDQTPNTNEKLYVHDQRGLRLVLENRTGVDLDLGAGGDERQRPVMVTPDGRHLLFRTRAPITGFDNVSDRCAEHPTSRCTEVFLFSEGSGITCISCNPAGQRPISSTVRSGAGIKGREDQDPAVSVDGSRAVFETADQLIPEDTNLRVDVYEYFGGRLSLVSSGRGEHDSYLIGMSASGRDVFFATFASLVPQDVDGGNQDVYDARLGGGFGVPPPASPAECSDDACQGNLGPRIPLWGPPATGELRGGEQQSRTANQVPARKKLQILGLSRRSRRVAATSGRLAVRVRATGGGRLSLKAAPTRGRANYGRASRQIQMRAETTAVIIVTIAPGARRKLDEQHRLSIRLTATLEGLARPRHRTVVLTKESAKR